MASFAAVLKTRDEELAELEKGDRVLAALEASVQVALAKAEAAEARSQAAQLRLDYELARSMRPLPSVEKTTTETPDVEALADDNLAESVERSATEKWHKGTKNAGARTDKQVRSQRWLANRAAEQRDCHAIRRARESYRLRCRDKRFDFLAGFEEAATAELEVASPKRDPRAQSTGQKKGKAQTKAQKLKAAGARAAGEHPRDRWLAKRVMAQRMREARRLKRRRLFGRGKRFYSGGNLSGESDEEVHPTRSDKGDSEKMGAQASDASRKSAFGSVLSWFGGLFKRGESTPTADMEKAPASSQPVRAHHQLTHVKEGCVRKALKRAAHRRRLSERRSARTPARPTVAARPPAAGAAPQRKKPQPPVVTVELELGLDDVQRLEAALTKPTELIKLPPAEQPLNLDLMDRLEGYTDVIKPSHGTKNTSTMTDKQISCRKWEAAREKESREREHTKKLRDVKRGLARDRKLSEVAEPEEC